MVMQGRLAATDPRIEEVDVLCDKINGFGRLPPGWNGDDAIAPSQDAIHAARSIVRELPRAVELPQVNPSPDGEIAFTWFKGQKRLSAVIDPDLHLVWGTLSRSDDRVEPGDDIDLHARSSQPLIEAVETLYK
jgi:hypothetical protein